MPESFEMFAYIEHLRLRWRLVALACGVAAALALALSLAMPNEYTATARILIEPPAGSDPRATVAVSPIYLESLKTYELLASGDRLFLDAVEHFKLPRSRPIDRMKQSVLKVRIARNTKILEISATLPDPRHAQTLALYIAQQAVRLAHDVSLTGDQALIGEAQKQWEDARTRMDQAELAWVRRSAQPLSQRAQRAAEIDSAQAQREAARQAFESAERRLQEVRSLAGYRGERLSIVDPGVAPERPSWPNLPLILVAAVLVALTGSLLFLTFEFHYRASRTPAPRAVAPLARVKGLND